SIFLYETAKIYLKNKPLNLKRTIFAYLSILFLGLAVLFSNQYYTATVFIFMSIFMILVYFTNPSFLRETIYWKWILVTYSPFLIVNYFLTSLPIVSYSSKAIWGIRITTIPLEDFFYSFALLSLNLFFYLLAKDKWLERK
ncbi:MAG: lycopene cyclase domain-containing protein, partial [Melioribacteraceae bacterium]